MHPRTILALVSVVLLLAAGLAAQKTDSAQAMLRAATDKAVVDGDLNGAITQYQAIIDRFKTDRAVIATAFVRMAECYQKLGNETEAGRLYQRVMRDFGDQVESARQARTGLAALAETRSSNPRAGADSGGVVLQELRLDSTDMVNRANGNPYALSPDGTKVAYTKRGGDLVVRDLATSQETQVTDVKTAMYPVWSPDGKKIVYTEWQSYWKYEMHIVSLETGEDQHREINGFAHDWSKDGRSILYAEGVEKPRWTLNLLPVEGGPIRQIIDEDNSKIGQHPRLSPDGKYVAYSLVNPPSLFLVRVEGGNPVRISEGSAHDAYPMWAPDGKMLLFVSDRNLGRWDLWGLRVVDGKPSGEPFMIRPDIGSVQLFSLSENGRLLMARSEARSNIYITAIDPDTGQALGDAMRLPSASSGSDGGVWSRDGRHIVYRAGGALRVMSEDGSNDRELPRPETPRLAQRIAWGPDNDHLYFADSRPGTGVGIYSVSASTKEIKPVFLDPEILGHVDVSPDGKRLTFVKGLQSQQNVHIYIADIDGKNLRQVTFETTAQALFPAWSPDGKQLAFYKCCDGSRKTSLWLLDVDDGRLTQVFEGPASEHTFFDPSWSPDGKRIAWSSRDGTGTRDGFELRVMGLTPGEAPKAIRPNLGSPVKLPMFGPNWSPDGKKMMFLAGTAVYQVLLMENFLPRFEESGKNNVGRPPR